MATMNGVSPEQMAKDIVNAAVEDKLVSISGTSFQKLEVIVRYLNHQKISAKGNSWLVKNFDNLVTDTLETLIAAREKGIINYLDKKELHDKDDSFRELLARGTEFAVAYKQVYGEAAFNAYTVSLAEKKAAK